MRTFSMLLVVLLVTAAAGCSGHGPYEAGTYKPGTTSLEHTENVVYADNIKNKVFLVDHNVTVEPDGRLTVYAELENRTKKNLVVQVQTQFREASGNLSKDMTNWKTIVMAPHSSTSYTASSMNDKAKDYVVRVKLERQH